MCHNRPHNRYRLFESSVPLVIGIIGKKRYRYSTRQWMCNGCFSRFVLADSVPMWNDGVGGQSTHKEMLTTCESGFSRPCDIGGSSASAVGAYPRFTPNHREFIEVSAPTGNQLSNSIVSIIQSINRSINQPINQSTNQSSLPTISSWQIATCGKYQAVYVLCSIPCNLELFCEQHTNVQKLYYYQHTGLETIYSTWKCRQAGTHTHTCKLAKCIHTHPYSNNAHKRLGPICIYIVGLPTQFNQLNHRPPSMVVRSPT